MVHVMGDKRDHFEALPDVWETFRIVLDERKRREIDPTLAVLHECIEKAKADKQIGKHTEQKLRELAEFFEVTTGWYEQVRNLPIAGLKQFAKLGGKAGKLLGLRL
jgi:DNA-binding transcriptional regulator GbsR (MarR family)